MSFEPNETNPRGTCAQPKLTFWDVWGKRLLKMALWAVWLIDKALRLISWAIGEPPG